MEKYLQWSDFSIEGNLHCMDLKVMNCVFPLQILLILVPIPGKSFDEKRLEYGTYK